MRHDKSPSTPLSPISIIPDLRASGDSPGAGTADGDPLPSTIRWHEAQPENIHRELRDVPQWVAFRAPLVTKPDGTTKFNKIPVNPRTGGNASSARPDTWGTFEAAVSRMEKLTGSGAKAGVGFQFTHEAGISAIDLDHCVDDAGELSPSAAGIVARFPDAWVELSPSGNGVHLWMRGTLPGVTSAKYPPGTAGHDCGVEIFCSRFFMTVTGIVPGEVEDRPLRDYGVELRRLYDELEGTKGAAAVEAVAAPVGVTVEEFEETVIRGKLAGINPSTRQAATGTRGDTGHKWVVTCPWADSHTGGGSEAAVFLFAGSPSFKCLHAHCANRTYSDLVDKFDLPSPSFIEEFNREYAVCLNKGQAFILRETEAGDVDFCRPDAVRLYLQNKTSTVKGAGGKPVEITLWTEWLRHPKRRTYSGVGFAPNGQTPPNIYNLWRGFAVTPRVGDWSMMRDHLKDVICGGNEEHFQWVLAWCARILQDPGGKRPGTALVLRGGQGTGKGMFVHNFGRMFGPHGYLQHTNPEEVVRKFNAAEKEKLLIFADEAAFAGDIRVANILKGKITEPTVTIEAKGIDPVVLTSYANYIFATNADHAMHLDWDSRRYLCLEVSNRYRQNTFYFGALQAQMDAGGVEAWMYDLLRYPWQDFDLRNPPRTEELRLQKIQSLPPVAAFWHECMEAGVILLADDDLRTIGPAGWPAQVVPGEVHNGYLAFCKKIGRNHRVANNVFWRQLRTDTGYEFGQHRGDDKGGGRRRMNTLPDLEEARAKWADRIGGA